MSYKPYSLIVDGEIYIFTADNTEEGKNKCLKKASEFSQLNELNLSELDVIDLHKKITNVNSFSSRTKRIMDLIERIS